LAKKLRSPPPKLSQDLAAKLNLETNFINLGFSAVVAVGPYINFKLSAKAASVFIQEAHRDGMSFGGSDSGRGVRVLLEYSSPNVAKEFHIGHFRNTILGQSLYNLYARTGHDLVAVNHLGDWGSQFGKVALAFRLWGDEEKLKNEPLAYLTTLYVRFHEEAERNPDLDRDARLEFKKIETGDVEATRLWKKFVELSIEDLKKIYSKLGAKFDHYLGESFYYDKISALVSDLREKKLLVESEGAQIVSLEAFDMPPCLVLTGDGTSLYHTRDLAAAIYRQQTFHFDRALYVVGSEQSLHFQQLFKVLELMGFKWSSTLEHVKYGLYRFKDGKFSTRKGKVILFSEVLEEARVKVDAIIAEKNPGLSNRAKVAEEIALGALVFNDLSTDRVKDVEFDWTRILDFEGDTGPYLQYTHARAASILRKAKSLGVLPAPTQAAVESVIERHAAALELAKCLGRMNGAVEACVRMNKPSLVAHFALELAKSFNFFYRSVKVLDENESKDLISARLHITAAAKIVLSNSLGLLCMGAPDEM
jgi:arginyl-tRNA synthetase